MHVLLDKLKEVLSSVLPITVIVLILHFTIAPLETELLVRFLIAAVLIILGLSILLFGIDVGLTPIGNTMGSRIAKSNKVWIVAAAGLFLGLIISFAEPDLWILAEQITNVTQEAIGSVAFVTAVSIGIGIMVMIGLLRILFDVSTRLIIFIAYVVIFILALFASNEFIGMSFDASGATTGAVTVPFLLALALGVSHLKKNGKTSEEDSFGLVGIASSGAIIGVLLLYLISKPDQLNGVLPEAEIGAGIFRPFLRELPHVISSSIISIAPITIIFIFMNFFVFKLKAKAFTKILKGIIYVIVGLILFLLGVNAGFMDVGQILGTSISLMENQFWIYIVSLILGLTVILAEPAVYTLTHQIEDVTNGHVQRRIVLVALSLGVGLAVLLNTIRIMVPGMELWHILLPGFALAIVLMFFTPKLFVGMAFDSGGVASGPMSATFILAFSQGVAFRNPAIVENPVADAFGVIALIALTPIIAVEILGLLFKAKEKKVLSKRNKKVKITDLNNEKVGVSDAR